MRLILAALLLCLFAFPAHAVISAGKEFLRAPPAVTLHQRHARPAKVQKARGVHRRAAIARAAPRPSRTIGGYAQQIASGPSRSLAGVVPELASKAREIAADCGARVISAVRNTYIAGTRTKSLHASGRAVDMAGNPSCIARHLANWRGGASNDYHRVAHYHISWGGYEHGRRFAHGVSRKTRKTRYARAG